MRIKNIKLSFLILGGLMILSFAFFSAAEESSTTDNNVFSDSDQDGLADTEEKTYGTDPLKADTDGDSYSDGAEVKAGYDPTKPAPGDRVVEDKTAPVTAGELMAEKENLTKEITTKLSAIVNDPDAETGAEINLEDVQSVVDESLQSKIQAEPLPEIDTSTVKIINQDYKKLSAEEKNEKKKQDFLTYVVGISYILSSNSPTPVTADSDPASLISSYGQQIISAITSQNPSALEGLSKSGQKVTEQMKEVEVPEELLDLHVKGLQFAEYAVELKDGLAPNPDDPMMDIVDFSKMQGFLDSLASFGYEAQSKLSQYDVQTIQGATAELKNDGIDVQN